MLTQNIVVYEALKKGEALDANKPVDVYWLDIDPAYVAANRKKGIMTDRSEVGEQNRCDERGGEAGTGTAAC